MAGNSVQPRPTGELQKQAIQMFNTRHYITVAMITTNLPNGTIKNKQLYTNSCAYLLHSRPDIPGKQDYVLIRLTLH
jgi:hypothetical protein